MNRLLEEIAQVCRHHLLDEKWLLAPSLRVGHQWLTSMARRGIPTVNVHIKTLRTVALDLAAPEMATKGLAFASDSLASLLLASVWDKIERQPKSYLLATPATTTLIDAAYATIQDIRLAGLNASDLLAEAFEVPAKAQDLCDILQAYKRILKEEHQVDYADVLAMAIEALRLPEAQPAALLLVPAGLRPYALEQSMLETWPADRLIRLPVDGTDGRAADSGLTDAGRLAWLLAPGDAPPPVQDGTACLFHAVGEANEVREVLRRCLEQGLPLDDVELLYTLADPYLGLIYETCQCLRSGSEATEHGLPVTLVEGVPVYYSRPGRALAAWLSWIEQDFPQDILVRMLQDDLLRLDAKEEEHLWGSRAASLLRSIPIGFGRDRYIHRIDEEIEALGYQLKNATPTDDEDAVPVEPERLRKRQAELLQLRKVVQAWIKCTASPEEPVAVLAAAAEFLSKHAHAKSELDQYALVRLVEEIERTRRWVEKAPPEAWSAAEYLTNLPEQLRVLGSGPRPGHLHVAPMLAGGHSGRGHTFVVGLDDGRFPGAGLQDPLLLDTERKAISPALPTAAADLEARLRDFAALLARLEGHITLSYPSYDILEDRELSPSPVVLSAYRILSGNREADQRDLVAGLGPPASFVPIRPEAALHAADWWLCHTCGPAPSLSLPDLVEQHWPNLRRGRQAAQCRASSSFTAYDGLVPLAGKECNPFLPAGPVLSPSGLELLGKCPRAYFLRYVLHLKPPEEMTIDPAVWLDPGQMGSLLHEVFCQFLRQLAAHGKMPPKVSRDGKRLDGVLAGLIQQYSSLYPPPSESAYDRQVRELRGACRVFLSEEEQTCIERTPVYMETCLGMPPDEEGTPLDTPEPLQVLLPGGRRIRIRGKIDRIDRIGGKNSNRYAVLDYKSGGTWKYSQEPPFWSGRVLQHAVYLQMAQQRLRQIQPKAEVIEFAYFFPGLKGQGERVTYSSEQLAEAPQLLAALCQLVAGGAFLSTDEGEKDCTYCDYTSVCGTAAQVTQECKAKILADSSPCLEPFRTVRHYDA